MPDDLRTRRLEHLVDQIEKQMLHVLHPSFGDRLPEISIAVTASTVNDTRRAARIAGERLGWRVSTHVLGDWLHVRDERSVRYETNKNDQSTR